MIAITNPKITSLVPEWAPYPGISLLFDNPGDCLRPAGRCRLLACDVATDPALGFYKRLRAALESLDLQELSRRYLFCPLPASSYHVTVWDGANFANHGEASHPCDLIPLLDGLPDSLAEDNPFFRLIHASPIVTEPHEIRFAFAELLNWGNASLVATLNPADEASAAVLGRISEERDRLTADFAAAFGVRTSRHEFHPHVSLGYFANPEAGEGSRARLGDWQEAFRHAVGHATVAFQTVGLYGFTDMASFYRG